MDVLIEIDQNNLPSGSGSKKRKQDLGPGQRGEKEKNAAELDAISGIKSAIVKSQEMQEAMLKAFAQPAQAQEEDEFSCIGRMVTMRLRKINDPVRRNQAITRIQEALRDAEI